MKHLAHHHLNSIVLEWLLIALALTTGELFALDTKLDVPGDASRAHVASGVGASDSRSKFATTSSASNALREAG
jgi:hypothetical protein